ncbi:RNA polymerase sigma factor [Moorellaceae bacterium AZ2]
MDVPSLIKRIQEGDLHSFEVLVEQYSGKALRTAYFITGRKDIIEDAVQEAFVQCYRKIKSLRDPMTFEAWFYRILTRVCWRLTAKEKGTVSLDTLSEGRQEPALLDNTTEDALEAGETRWLVQQAISKLSPSLRTTVILRYYNDLSIKEIAKVLGSREGTIKSRLHTALGQLAGELERLGWRVTCESGTDGKNIDLLGKECEISEASTS